jgi:hypothetical protein
MLLELTSAAAVAALLSCCSYMTFAIGAAAEAVATMVVAPSVDRIGRHNIVAMGNLLGGAACLACANVASGTTQAALSAIGKFGCAGVSAFYVSAIDDCIGIACEAKEAATGPLLNCKKLTSVTQLYAGFISILPAAVYL